MTLPGPQLMTADRQSQQFGTQVDPCPILSLILRMHQLLQVDGANGITAAIPRTVQHDFARPENHIRGPWLLLDPCYVCFASSYWRVQNLDQQMVACGEGRHNIEGQSRQESFDHAMKVKNAKS
jgi:hypothetical protein